MQTNFEAYKIKTIFDWKDLPIPKEILNILKNSTTRQPHDLIEVKLSQYNKSYIDPTWNPELEALGFPVTTEWEGKGSTKQITREPLEYFESDNFNPENHEIITDKEEYDKFAQALNKWLESNSVTQK